MSKLPTIPGFTEEDLEALAPEEIAALEAEHIAGSPESEANLRELAEGAEAGEEGEEKPAESAPAAEQPAEGSADAGEDAPTTTFRAEAPADAEAKLAEATAAKQTAKTEEAAALKQLHDGEIDFDAYNEIKAKSDAAIEAANETISDLKTAIKIAERDAAAAQQEVANAWSKEVATLMANSKAEGFDYKGNEKLSKELNGLVRAFGQEATEQGMSDDGLKASKWALAQAHAMMKLRHPELVKAAPANTGTKPPAPASNTPQPRHALTALNNMPNADRTLGDNDEVSKFSQLEGEDLERAMARMSPAEVEKLMASV